MRNDIISSLALRRMCYILLSDLDRVMAKYKANLKLAPGPQHLKQEKEKAKKKREKGEARNL